MSKQYKTGDYSKQQNVYIPKNDIYRAKGQPWEEIMESARGHALGMCHSVLVCDKISPHIINHDWVQTKAGATRRAYVLCVWPTPHWQRVCKVLLCLPLSARTSRFPVISFLHSLVCVHWFPFVRLHFVHPLRFIMSVSFFAILLPILMLQPFPFLCRNWSLPRITTELTRLWLPANTAARLWPRRLWKLASLILNNSTNSQSLSCLVPPCLTVALSLSTLPMDNSVVRTNWLKLRCSSGWAMPTTISSQPCLPGFCQPPVLATKNRCDSFYT